jgi:hypothetical protein
MKNVMKSVMKSGLVLPLLAFMALTIACSSESNEGSTKIGINNQGEELTMKLELGEESSVLGIRSIIKYEGKLDQLFPTSLAAKYLESGADEIDKDYGTFDGNPIWHDLSYSADKGRIRKMDLGFTTIEVPNPNYLTLKMVGATTRDRFDSNHRAVTEEDLKRLSRELNNSSENKLAGEMAQSFAAQARREPVSGVGEAAVWLANESTLAVFQKGITFSLYVDVSENEQDNLNTAKKLALDILGNLF